MIVLQTRCNMMRNGLNVRKFCAKCSACAQKRVCPEKLNEEVEDLVGYSMRSLNSEWLLKDYNLAEVGTGANEKPIILESSLIKSLSGKLFNPEYPSYGLITLLLSKIIGSGKNISNKHKLLSQATEAIKNSVYPHYMLDDINNGDEKIEIQKDIKMKILIGDYIIARSHNLLAEIDNTEVEETMSSALRDLSQAVFLKEENEGNTEPQENLELTHELEIAPLNPSKYAETDKVRWILRNSLGGALVLGKSCTCVGILEGVKLENRKNLFQFGLNFALTELAFQKLKSLSLEYQISDKNNLQRFNNEETLFRNVGDLVEEFSSRTMNNLENFPQCRPKVTLKNIIEHFRCETYELLK